MSLKATNIHYRYAGNPHPLLRGIDLELNKGQCLAILGRNGSGKTTLSKILMGIYKPERGNVIIDGLPLEELSLARTGEKIGYLFQNPSRQLFCTSVEEEITFALKYKNLQPAEISRRLEASLEFFHLSHLRHQFPFTLSQGERQRLALASIMVLNPPYFILDEPTTGLDSSRKLELGQYLDNLLEQKQGILIISHDRSFVYSLAHEIKELKHGQLQEVAVACS